MNHLDSLIYDLALILVTAGITTVIFKKINQLLVLGYILAGFLVSANFQLMPNIAEPANIAVWGELGVIFIMFVLGLEFSFQKIANIGNGAIVIAFTVVFSMIAVGYGAGSLLGWQKMDCIFLGGMLSMSSTMIIIKAYEEMHLKRKKYAYLVLGSLVMEDIVAVFLLIILSTISIGKNVSGFGLAVEVGKMLIYLSFWLICGIYVIPLYLRKFDKYMKGETLLITSLGICLGMVVIANLLGFSSALGAFVAGSVLSSTTYAEDIEEHILPIKNFFGAVFFVSVGMLVNISILRQYIVPILLLSLLTILGQMIFSFIGALASGQSLKTSVGVCTSMVQIGEFSFIIASLGTNLGVTSDFLYPIVVSISVITTFLTPILIKQNDRMYVIIARLIPKKIMTFLRQYTSEKQIENEKNPEWSQYLKQVIPRILISSVVMLCLFMIDFQFLTPYLSERTVKPSYGRIFAGMVTLCAMAPAINMISYKRNPLYVKLWLANKTNRLPLVAFKTVRTLISLLFVMLTVNYMISIPLPLLWLISLLVVVFSIKSDFMASHSIKLETMFVANFNQRTLEENKTNKGVAEGYRWLDETLYVKTYDILKIDIPPSIKDAFYQRHKLGVQIIKIIRGDVHINNPTPNDEILEGDMVVVLAKKEYIDAYEMILKKFVKIETHMETTTLRDYVYKQIFTYTDIKNHMNCIAIKIDDNSEFCYKSIQSSGFKENYKAFVIGVDRGAFSIISPNKNTVIESGDIVWVLGSQEMVDRFLEKGIID